MWLLYCTQSAVRNAAFYTPCNAGYSQNSCKLHFVKSSHIGIFIFLHFYSYILYTGKKFYYPSLFSLRYILVFIVCRWNILIVSKVAFTCKKMNHLNWGYEVTNWKFTSNNLRKTNEGKIGCELLIFLLIDKENCDLTRTQSQGLWINISASPTELSSSSFDGSSHK